MRIRPTDFDGYNRLYRNVSGLWFTVCAHKNPSALEMEYNIVDKVIPVEVLSDDRTRQSWSGDNLIFFPRF